MKNLTFQITEEADSCVRLFALTQGVSLSQVLKGTVSKWILDNDISSEKLKGILVDNLVNAWVTTRFLKPESSYRAFHVHNFALLARKLPKGMAEEIMREVEQKVKQ